LAYDTGMRRVTPLHVAAVTGFLALVDRTLTIVVTVAGYSNLSDDENDVHSSNTMTAMTPPPLTTTTKVHLDATPLRAKALKASRYSMAGATALCCTALPGMAVSKSLVSPSKTPAPTSTSARSAPIVFSRRYRMRPSAATSKSSTT
jgi:hypothetical protein